MVDRPPPQRYRIIERGGRLEVLDSETGGRPQSAAERMAIHDAAHGHAALRYDRLNDSADPAGSPSAGSARPTAAPMPAPAGAGAQRPPADPIRAALSERTKPWSQSSASRPQLGAQSAAEAQARPGPNSGASSSKAQSAGSARRDSQPIVTGRWWDAKGPRSVQLGVAGRKRLTSGFATALIMTLVIAFALLIIQPVLLLVAGFVLFRFGGTIIGPLGARLIDEAIKADGAGR